MNSTSSSGRPRREKPRFRIVFIGSAAFAPLLAFAAPALAQIEGASYTLQPSYNVIRWGDNVGIDDTELYGGRLGLNLGRYIALQGFYLGRNDVDTRLRDVDNLPAPGMPLSEQQIDLRLYGADVVLNISPNNNVVPFLKAGGGILRLDPEIGDESEHIAMKLGGGIRFGIARLQGELFAEDLAFRANRYRLAPIPEGTPIPNDPDDQKLRHNLSVGAGVNFNLGGYSGRGLTETDRAIADRFRSGLNGLSVPIEPFVGRLDFSDRMGLDTQDLFGVRTGMDFGRYFGLRGYYWRGVNDDWNKTVDMQSWGGEAQFSLNAGSGAVPYLIAGLGQLDFQDDFVDPSGKARDDETMLILGAGLGLNLSHRLQLNVAARDHVISNEDLDNVTTTDELSSNWMASAGLTFSLFGDAPDREVLLTQDRDREPESEPVRTETRVRMREREVRNEDEGDAGPDTTGMDEWGSFRARMMHERMARAMEQGPRWRFHDGAGRPEAGPPVVRNYQGDRVFVLPVPEEGEIYVRYGAPGGVEINSRAGGYMITKPEGGAAMMTPLPPGAMVPGTPAAPVAPPTAPSATAPPAPAASGGGAAPAPAVAPAAPAGTSSSAEDAERRAEERMDRIEKLLSERLDRMEERLDERLDESRTDTSRDEDFEKESPLEHDRSGGGLHPEAVRVYTGINVDSPTQGVFGGRLNLGPVSHNSDFDFLPELALGFGDGQTTFMIAGNLYYDFPSFGETRSFSPFVGAGLGLLRTTGDGNGDENARKTGTEAVLNFGYGLTADFGRYTAFAEHQGIDIFDLNRILVGLRLNIQ